MLTCVYDLAGHGLRELDIELMRRLSPRVNVIPVIGKADSLTPLELAESKELIMEDIEHYRIPVYNFPYDIEEDDEDTVEENAELRGLMPFAIVGSEEIVEVCLPLSRLAHKRSLRTTTDTDISHLAQVRHS